MDSLNSASEANDRSAPERAADGRAPLLLPVAPAWEGAPNAPASYLATMLLEAAVRFVDLPTADFDAVIVQTLDQLTAYVQMEHVGLTLLQEAQTLAEQSVTPGQPTAARPLHIERRYLAGGNYLHFLEEVTTPLPWYTEQLRNGKLVILPNGTEGLPPEAKPERAYIESQGIKSTLVVPLRIGEQLLGSLYFISTSHAYTWHSHDLHALTLFARVLAGAAQRKQANAILRRNEEQLAFAIDAAGIGTWVWDIEHPERSYGSGNLEKIHGISPCPKEESLHLFMENLHPEDRFELELLFARCIQGEAQDFAVEHRLFWPDGSLHWVETRGYVVFGDEGRPIRLTGVLQEITQRKDAEAQLAQQQIKLLRQARMMEQTEQLGAIGGWEWDIANMGYYFTPETYRIFGLSPATYSPDLESVLSYFPPTSRSIVQSALQRSLDYGEALDLKVQLTTAQGKTIWVRFAGRTEMVDGRVMRLYGSIQDITLRTQIEEQLREAQKLEAVGQLAGGIAHDFNNLLTTINGMSELALLFIDRMTATSGVERVRNYLHEIHRAGDRAADLTRQLLAFSRKQVLHPKVLDLRSEITRSQDLFQQILGENIELIVIVPSHLGLVMADPSQIEQTIVNLVINARDAMPNGGTLTIRLQNRTLDKPQPNLKLPPGNYVVLEVQDSGQGMTPEVQARLFDPFFTTKSLGAGTGLGLATVYGIVKQSGGVIQVESQLTIGTTFRIFLPQSVIAEREGKAAPSYVRGGVETILLAGGDEWARRGYRVAMEAKGYRLLDAASGQESITLCQSYPGPIHLLVISELADMGASSVANQALLSRAEMRVLLLESSRKGAGESGDARPEFFTLHKPFTPDILIATVRSILDSPASMPLL